MHELIQTLVQKAGCYIGHGTNHEGESFTGELILTSLLSDKGISLRFVATGKDRNVFHQEHSTIAPSIMGGVALWNFNSNVSGLLQHDLRRKAKPR